MLGLINGRYVKLNPDCQTAECVRYFDSPLPQSYYDAIQKQMDYAAEQRRKEKLAVASALAATSAR